ncbi:hypothetical protein FN846DRAFT_1013099 [Sphaerosporella brunnea]|uniref:Uncharacterized protein n=1 Tax=Sphaerosporella brunnea TaxID=1250544 RepID=A0A5J5EXL0_9PEZI|nr:hypothetical protein FN846DRAFT_1013099 [Sphaerosporella brunnea]
MDDPKVNPPPPPPPPPPQQATNIRQPHHRIVCETCVNTPSVCVCPPADRRSIQLPLSSAAVRRHLDQLRNAYLEYPAPIRIADVIRWRNLLEEAVKAANGVIEEQALVPEMGCNSANPSGRLAGVDKATATDPDVALAASDWSIMDLRRAQTLAQFLSED